MHANADALRARIGTTLLVFPLLTACAKAPKGEVVDGRPIFESTCARCHGVTGVGGIPANDGAPAPRNFRDHTFQTTRSNEELRRVIVQGKGAAMPAFGSMFSDAQLDALVRHVRSFDPGVHP